MMVYEVGKGHAALQKFQTVLGLNKMHLKTFQRHNRKVDQSCQSVADTSLDTATEIIRGVYGDLMDDAGVIDITVSFDGTWQKRGFTSHHGVGVAIEVQTRLVIDSYPSTMQVTNAITTILVSRFTTYINQMYILQVINAD